MNTSVYTANIIRFFVLLTLQVLVVQNIQLGKISIYIYPIFILLLPLELLTAIALPIVFLHGLLIDIFTNTDGLHAAISVWVMFSRPLICMFLEPRGGYQMGQTLTKHSLGVRWFLKYSAIMMANHVLFVILLEDLSLSWVGLIRFILSFILSWFFVVLYQFIINPKY